MKRLMVPPLPAASRPSNRITTRWPVSFTQICSWSSSTCGRFSAPRSSCETSGSCTGKAPLRQSAASSSSGLSSLRRCFASLPSKSSPAARPRRRARRLRGMARNCLAASAGSPALAMMSSSAAILAPCAVHRFVPTMRSSPARSASMTSPSTARTHAAARGLGGGFPLLRLGRSLALMRARAFRPSCDATDHFETLAAGPWLT